MPTSSQPQFAERIAAAGHEVLQPNSIDTLQINLGKMCNQTCSHCHVDAGPTRKEIMSRETLEECLRVIRSSNFEKIDLTGGAPEMNPHFRWFVQEVRKLDRHVMVRCNLTIIMSHKKYADLPKFFCDNQVHVISSLPCYSAKNTDEQRGKNVFNQSIEALKKLNEIGYGKSHSNLILDLVYNPNGTFLPPPQKKLENDYKSELREKFGIEFNSLFAITNMPISRFLDHLRKTGQEENYMQTLIEAFNPQTLTGLMCRNTLSVSWDGKLYDCDFNQMLEIPVTSSNSRKIQDFNWNDLSQRKIALAQHCYGCTAGAGSSCGGELA